MSNVPNVFCDHSGCLEAPTHTSSQDAGEGEKCQLHRPAKWCAKHAPIGSTKYREEPEVEPIHIQNNS